MNEKSVAALDVRLQKQVESARQAFERGAWDIAVDLCRNVLATEPGCLPVRKLHRAAQLKRAGGSAVSKFLRGVSTAPFRLRGAVGLSKDPMVSVADAQRLLDADPHDATGLRLLGNAASALGWCETAVFAFEARRENAPDDGENLVALGRAHLAAGRPQLAVQCAEAVLRMDGIDGAAQALLKDASVAQTMRAGNWSNDGDFRSKLRE